MPTGPSPAQAARRSDPYRNFRFLVKWNDAYVAGVSQVSGLGQRPPAATFRDGGDPASARIMPGQTDYSPITLARGECYDIAFTQWASKVWDYTHATPTGTTLHDFRKEIVIEVFNEAGQKVLAYTIHNCWPSEFTASPELDGTGNGLVIETLVLQHEGWERATTVGETAEPGFTLPQA